MARSTLRDPANRKDPNGTSQRAGLGYRQHPEWRDMSEFAVHFTGAAGGLSASAVLRKIMNERELVPGPAAFGAAHKLCALGDSQRSVCFSEIPLDMLDRLVDRRSRYGLAFRKDFLGRAGGAPVWYLERGTPIAKIFFEMSTAKTPIDPDAPIWKITPFVDYPGEYRGCTYQFEWEREWRVPGSVSFAPGDNIAFMFVPEAEHAELREAFPTLDCPLVDPGWGEDRLQTAFSTAT